jgi:fluoride exporter
MTFETSRGVGPDELPIDPDLALPEDARHQPPADRRPRPPGRHGPRLRSTLRPDVLATIALGGALGGGARYLIERTAAPAAGRFPWATFAINVSGAFTLALLLVFILDVWPPTRYVRPFAAIGFLGAFTTFSTWMVETADLLGQDRPAVAAAYLAGSLFAGLAAVSLGLIVGRSVRTRRTGAGTPEGS